MFAKPSRNRFRNSAWNRHFLSGFSDLHSSGENMGSVTIGGSIVEGIGTPETHIV